MATEAALQLQQTVISHIKKHGDKPPVTPSGAEKIGIAIHNQLRLVAQRPALHTPEWFSEITGELTYLALRRPNADEAAKAKAIEELSVCAVRELAWFCGELPQAAEEAIPMLSLIGRGSHSHAVQSQVLTSLVALANGNDHTRAPALVALEKQADDNTTPDIRFAARVALFELAEKNPDALQPAIRAADTAAVLETDAFRRAEALYSLSRVLVNFPDLAADDAQIISHRFQQAVKGPATGPDYAAARAGQSVVAARNKASTPAIS